MSLTIKDIEAQGIKLLKDDIMIKMKQSKRDFELLTFKE